MSCGGCAKVRKFLPSAIARELEAIERRRRERFKPGFNPRAARDVDGNGLPRARG